MKHLISLVFLFFTTVSQAQVCVQSWKNQDANHVTYFQTQMAAQVKAVLIAAYKRVDVEITESQIDFQSNIISSGYLPGFPYFDTIMDYSVARVTVGETTTDYRVTTNANSTTETNIWKIRTYFNAEPIHNAIGDLVGYLCSTNSSPMNAKDLYTSSFSIIRATTGFSVGTVKLNSYRELDEEIN